MSEAFKNDSPLRYGESRKQREIFDRLATRIKDRAAEQGKAMTDAEAIEATRNWLGYAQLAYDVVDRQLHEESKRSEAETQQS